MANIPPPPDEQELYKGVPPPPPEASIWNNQTLAGRDARYSAVNGAVSGAVSDIGHTMLGDPSQFHQPVASDNPNPLLSSLSKLAQPFQGIVGPSRLSATISQPGQEAGQAVENAVGLNHPIVGKIGNFVTSAALDPQSYAAGLAAPEAKAGNVLEDFAAQQANKAAGISDKVVTSIAGGKNPAEVGHAIGKDLVNAGALKGTASDTWKAVSSLTKESGKDVGNALDAIQKAAEGVNANLTNPVTSIDSKTALQPLLDAWSERAGGMTSARKLMAKPFEEVHQGLSQAAAKQGGMLTLDNVKAALDEVGPMVHKGSEEVQASMGELYGTLADMRDKMVEKIAADSGNPSLASDLLTANKKYSTYIRIMPDLTKKAAKEAVGKGVGIDQPVKYVVNKLAPKIAQAALGVSDTAASAPVQAAKKAAYAGGFRLFANPQMQSLHDTLMNQQNR